MSNITTINIIKTLTIVVVTVLLTWSIWSLTSRGISDFATTFSTGDSSKLTTKIKLDKMRRELRASSRHIEILSSAAITKEMVPTILNELEEQGVGEAKVVVSGVSEVTSRGIVDISLTIKCQLLDCINTTQKIAKYNKVVGVRRVSLISKESGVWDVTMNVTMPFVINDI